jgi:hypothetical protein
MAKSESIVGAEGAEVEDLEDRDLPYTRKIYL